MNTTSSPCAAALQAFRWPDLDGWHGLPDCRLAEVATVLTPGDPAARGSGHLGTRRRPLQWLYANGGGFPDSIRIWLDGDTVVALDTQLLVGRDAADRLTAALGAPSARLDAWFQNVLLKDSEWVYLDRGLSLVIEPQTGALLRLTAFPRTDLDDFTGSLRFLGGRFIRLDPHRSVDEEDRA